MTIYITKCAPFFSESPFLKTVQLNYLLWRNFKIGDLLKIFPRQCVSEDEACRKSLW